jgi:hypothetical protein
LYWDLYTNDSWKLKLDEMAAEQAKQNSWMLRHISWSSRVTAALIKSWNQQGEETTVDRMTGRSGRRGKKWFSYEIPTEAGRTVSLVVTYHSEERGKRTFDVLVEGQRIGNETFERNPPGSAVGRFFNVEYKIPVELIKDKTKLTVKFQATGGNETAAVYAVRVVRIEGK